MASSAAVPPPPPPDAPSPPTELLARRPGPGKVGVQVKLLANNFLVRFDSRRKFFHYDVTFTPDATHKGLKRVIVNTMIRLHFADILPVYDGEKSLYTSSELPKLEVSVEIDEKDEDGRRRRDRVYQVVLREASRPELAQLDQFLRGRTSILPQETLQVLDLVLRECPKNAQPLVSGGRSFYGDAIAKKVLGGGVEAWQGFYMSLRPIQRNGYLALTVDMTGNAFLSVQKLIDFVASCLRLDARDLNEQLKRQDARADSYRAQMKRLLKGIRVETNHGTKRRYKIDGLTQLPLKDLKFNMKDQEVSVVDYFRKTYNVTLHCTGFPALVCGKKKNFVPFELCQIVRGQNWTRKVNEVQRNGLSTMTCCKPDQRKLAIEKSCRLLKDESLKYTKQFGVEINSNLTQVLGRELPPPKVQFLNGEVTPRDGTWNMANKRLMEGREIKSWGIICCSSAVKEHELEAISKMLAESCVKYGMGMPSNMAFRPKLVRSPQAVEEALRSAVRETIGNNFPPLQFVLAIMPNSDNKGFYGAVKRTCELELGLVSQCAKDFQIKKLSLQYLANLVLKINVKFGGKNFTLSAPDQKRFRLISDAPSLIIGADVSHARDESCTSMAAVVASMDWPGFSQYISIVQSQAFKQEIVDGLFWEKTDEQGRKATGGIFKDILSEFYKRTNLVPQRIIYYRDGVSEGQFEAVLRQEFDHLKRAFEALGWGGKSELGAQKKSRVDEGPKVTFIVVQKRHHTCFFPDKPNSSDNIRPGTIVDTDICHPWNFDFYLCSHKGIKGTSRSAHYHVLKDENGFSSDEIQLFTHGLCHLYSRCTRSVSVVPPVYYAHLTAKRAQIYQNHDGSSAHGDTSTIASVEGTGTVGSSRGRGRGNRGPPPPVKPLPPLHDNIKYSMFML